MPAVQHFSANKGKSKQNKKFVFQPVFLTREVRLLFVSKEKMHPTNERLLSTVQLLLPEVREFENPTVALPQ